MISATIVGRLGRDPETRTVGEQTVTNVSVATDHGWGDRKTTTWVRLAIWGKRGQVVQDHLHKGDPIEASGEIYTRDHDGKTYVEMDCKSWAFVPKSSAGDGGGSRDTGRSSTPQAAADDDIPF